MPNWTNYVDNRILFSLFAFVVISVTVYAILNQHQQHFFFHLTLTEHTWNFWTTFEWDEAELKFAVLGIKELMS